ncbi:MAG TPA: hypothetical protein VFD70_14495 [Anaerolineae bacterium]|nr:hypothetical protein [Anaerolineae bacterium]
MKTQKHPSFVLRVKTRLRAGEQCTWIDTNCAAVDSNGQMLLYPDGTRVFNTCGNGRLAAGGDCNAALYYVKREYGLIGTCQRC